MRTFKSKNWLLLFILLIICGFSGHTLTGNNGDIPKGSIETFQFKDSKIFPGTVREIIVYIPAQIDPSKPACVYVQQDGLNPKHQFPEILDTLIAHKEIPVTVGIFIRPGSLPPANSNTLNRPNRCFEYDGVGDNYVRFLLEEILPYVSVRYKLNLSNNGNDRCIGGGSSGGISAFNAAWERPDAFSRIYCVSGSFVAFRGGHEFPTLIRKTEPKPIRAFLTTGSNDMENCAGDWTLLDQEMDKALKFSGYDYQFYLLKGGHGEGYADFFSDGMRYLWKGWPEPVKAGPGAPRVQDIILPNEPWHLVAEGFADTRGPACNANGEVFFNDTPNNKIYRIGIDGHVTPFLKNSGQSNGLSFGINGELYTVSKITGRIMSYDATGKGTLYADGIHGQYILAKPDGGIYVSSAPLPGETSKVWMVKNGTKTIVDTGISFATGIAMSPDQWLLAIADKESHWVYSYGIAPDGLLINKERFFWLHVQDWADNSGAESVCYDREGHLYVATLYGIQVCAWDGPVQVILPLPEGKVTGICIGGSDSDILFAFCNDKVYKRKIKNHALGAFTPWIKMTQGKL
jgi:gluconolactonase